MNKHIQPRVTVLVLGDFGRSPRMQYHVQSISKRNFLIDVVATKGSDPPTSISSNQYIHLHYMRDVPSFVSSLPGILRYVLKTIWQSFYLFFMLMSIPKMDCLLMQNPPSVPTLPVSWFVCCLRRSKLIVDFHNYGYTILALSAGEQNILVKISRWCEKFFSRRADVCFCVTKAMKQNLMAEWNVRAFVFYDCAPDVFHLLSNEEKHEFLMTLKESYSKFQSSSNINDETRFTRCIDGKVEMLPDRPALIISSTSWTEDEDFSILLSALEDYEKAANLQKNLPSVLVAITGKGPLKSYYERQIQNKNFTKVEILTLWLKAEDYPKLLACADLGISLHTSSSGLDLPMKVVDMFGCCLPVCAMSFSCLDELVKNDINGRIFKNSVQLGQQLQALLDGFPEKETDLSKFKKNLVLSERLRWEENWNQVIHPLLYKLIIDGKL